MTLKEKKDKKKVLADISVNKEVVPFAYSVDIQGSGRSQRAGTISKAAYEYFSEDNELLINHIFHRDEVPDEVHIGDWFDCDDIYEANGYELNGCTLSLDGNGETHRIKMNEMELKNLGVKLIKKIQTIEKSVKSGEINYFISGIEEQDGGWHYDLEIKEPFDPKKLELTISNFQSREIITSLVYDGHELEDPEGSYDTELVFEVIKVNKTRK